MNLKGEWQLLTHVVLFRLRDRSPDSINRAAEVLRGLDGNVAVLRGLEIGIDSLKSGRSYDIALIARLDSIEDLDRYQNDPYHVKVAEYMAGVRESAVAVDYEG